MHGLRFCSNLLTVLVMSQKQINEQCFFHSLFRYHGNGFQRFWPRINQKFLKIKLFVLLVLSKLPLFVLKIPCLLKSRP